MKLVPKPISRASATSTSTHYRTEIVAGRHSLVADEVKSRGGQDVGPAPYDYLLAGLGACTVMTLQMYAERKGWELGEHLRSIRGAELRSQMNFKQRALSPPFQG